MTRAEEASIAYQLVAHGPRVRGGDAVLSDDDFKFWNINYDFVAGYEQAEKDLAFMARVSSGPDGFFYGKGYQQAKKDLGWISVKDRLPKERGWYFTCINHYGTPQALGVTYYDGKEWLDDDDSTENVDYWMEVPKLPKEEENETK